VNSSGPQQPTCRHAIVDSGHGLTIVLRMASPGDDWVLTTIGDADASPNCCG